MALPLDAIGRFLSVLPLAVVGHERVSHASTGIPHSFLSHELGEVHYRCG